jgi:PAS domain S-box-containing protein
MTQSGLAMARTATLETAQAAPETIAYRAQLEYQTRLLEAIAEVATDGILVVDRDGRMSYFNRRFVELWSIPEEVVASRSDEQAIASVVGQLIEPDAFIKRVEYLYEHPTEKSQDEIRLRDGRVVDRYSAPVVDANGEALGRVWFFRDVSEAQVIQHAATLLARAGDLFGASLDVEHMLTELAQLVVPAVADWVALDVVDEAGGRRFRRAGVAHVDPNGAELLRELDARYPLRPGRGNLRGRVVASGQPLALYEVTDADLRRVARDAEHRRLLEALGVRSALWVPIRGRDRVLGVMSVGYSGARRYRPADLELVTELCRRAALAIENALLFRVVQHAEQRQAALARLGERALSGAPLREVMDEAADLLSQVLDVPLTEVFELQPDGRLLLAAGTGWHAGLIGQTTFDADERSMGGYAMTSMGPVAVEDLATERRFSPSKLLIAHGAVSGLTVPIGAGPLPDGALGVFDRQSRRFHEDDTNFVQSVANVLAAAIERRHSEERLQSLAALQRTRAAELRTVINSLGDAVVVADAAGAILLSNSAAARLLGPRIRHGLAAVLRAFDWPPGEKREVLPGRPVELRLARPDKPEAWLEITGYVVEIGEAADERDTGGAPARTGMILVMRDVTAVRNARAVRDAFAGILSHELRTPVTTIYGGSEMLVRGGLEEDARQELYEDIRAEADRLYRLVENLLVLSHVERQGLNVEREPVLLQRLLPRVVQAEGARWPKTRFEVDLPAGLPPVGGEEVYLEQVVRNLVSNAAKYGGDGPVTVTAVANTDVVKVTVTDTGPGFDDDEAKRLFELFYRTQAAVKRAGGAGVGLFVSKQLITAMGGTMWASKRQEGGAQFSFEIPIFAD